MKVITANGQYLLLKEKRLLLKMISEYWTENNNDHKANSKDWETSLEIIKKLS
jgi:hypothetical protein